MPLMVMPLMPFTWYVARTATQNHAFGGETPADVTVTCLGYVGEVLAKNKCALVTICELVFANLCFSIASSFALAHVCVFDGCDRFCGCVAFGDSGVVGSSGAWKELCVNHFVATCGAINNVDCFCCMNCGVRVGVGYVHDDSVVGSSGGCYFVGSCGATTLVVCFCCRK